MHHFRASADMIDGRIRPYGLLFILAAGSFADSGTVVFGLVPHLLYGMNYTLKSSRHALAYSACTIERREEVPGRAAGQPGGSVLKSLLARRPPRTTAKGCMIDRAMACQIMQFYFI